jgi:hypothetical protein
VSARMRPGREVLSQPPPEPERALAPADDIEHQKP